MPSFVMATAVNSNGILLLSAYLFIIINLSLFRNALIACVTYYFCIDKRNPLNVNQGVKNGVTMFA